MNRKGLTLALTVSALALPASLPAVAGAAERPRNGLIGFSAVRGAERVIYTRQSNGRDLRVVPGTAGAVLPDFSPRGRRLAFVRNGPLGSQVFITYLDGRGLRALTPGRTDSMPEFSSTGAELVFTRGTAGRRDLYRISTDGTGLRRLTLSARNDDEPSWSVADRIAFTRRLGRNDDIHVMSGRGGAARRLTKSRLADRGAAWSPTGRTIVFSRGRAGKRDLYVITADGRGLRRLTSAPGEEIEPEFSPDGTRVVFTHLRKGRRTLYLMKVKGRPLARLPRRSSRARRLTSSRSFAARAAWQPTGLAPVVAAAGDIACAPSHPSYNGGAGTPGVCRQKLTSDLLLRSDLDQVLIPGDVQYENGELENFRASFDPTWGRMKEFIRPVPGNHEYFTPGAAGYFDYFNGPGVVSGRAGDRGAGWYSFEVGSWHVIALNSECDFVGGCGPDSPQGRWLRDDLAAHPTSCTLAFFHAPRFTSGRYGEQSHRVRFFWEALYAAGADLVVSGHEHLYERFAPQTPDGVLDPARGIRQFTAGMGGKSRHPFVSVAPNSEVRDNRTLGVLELTLGEGTYDWKLVRAPTGRAMDTGSARCH
jgi:acid phosphatase type 7